MCPPCDTPRPQLLRWLPATLRKWPKARAVFATLVDKLPNHPVARNNLAWAHLHLGNLDAALEQATRARELAPDNAGIKDTFDKIETTRRDQAAPKRQ
ncbi:MAG: tetratricopeptide repeat protein [Alphaproteobacteria bacterium]|jgi:tetratricopeptide (TPR) repeat protein|nr:tetratricopeptide repeat protein [Alphaproteobacteria bacterium]MDP6815724.1 tetratricopeptide repeat protein [Alphaproteobacteria bacterium]